MARKNIGEKWNSKLKANEQNRHKGGRLWELVENGSNKKVDPAKGKDKE